MTDDIIQAYKKINEEYMKVLRPMGYVILSFIIICIIIGWFTAQKPTQLPDQRIDNISSVIMDREFGFTVFYKKNNDSKITTTWITVYKSNLTKKYPANYYEDVPKNKQSWVLIKSEKTSVGEVFVTEVDFHLKSINEIHGY